MDGITWQQFDVYLVKNNLTKASYYRAAFNELKSFFSTLIFNETNFAGFKYYLENKTSRQTGEKLSKYAINNYLKACKHIATCMVNNGLISHNFIADWKLHVTEKPHVDIIESTEMTKFLTFAYIKNYRAAVCLETFLKTGARSEELFTAQWKNLYSDELFLPLTKTRKSRCLELCIDLYEKIDKLQKYDHGYIFGGVKGKINRKFFNGFIKKCLQEASINKKVRTKELRHSYATLLAEMGVSTFTIKEMMGHTSIKTTENYIHVTKRMKRKAALAHPLTVYEIPPEERLKLSRQFVDSINAKSKNFIVEQPFIKGKWIYVKIPAE